MVSYKKLFTNWKVVLLLVFLVFSVITIQPQIFGNEGAMIKSVATNSSAADEGISNPSSRLSPLAKEKVLSLDGKKVTSAADYYNIQSNLDPDKIIRIQTNKATYSFLPVADAKGNVDLGIKVADAPSSNLRKGLDLAGGTRVLLQAVEKISAQDLETTVASLQERLNVYGLSDVVVRPAKDLQGTDFILIEIAGVTEEEVKELLAKQGKFEASITNQTVFFGGKKDITYVCRSAECSGIDPNRGCSRVGSGEFGCSFFFSITLSPEAAQRQADLTKDIPLESEGTNSYLTEDLILYLDDQEVDRLRIGADLKGRATTNIQISGSGQGRTEQEAAANTLKEMKKLQTIILTGSLPVKLDVVKMDTISPSLGQEFLRNITLVGTLVILSVIVVVFLRYRQIKVVIPMILTLVSEMVMILGFAALVGWNLDLAAIAGVIIVAGTGVDHLIVITDETLRGEAYTSWKQRIKNAMFIVIGAYLTTMSGMIPLLWAGAGLLKGFALTTIAGISFGVLVARPAFAAVIEELLKE